MVTITNDGHIQGDARSGIEVADGTTVSITNSSANSIIGGTNGIYIHDVDDVDINNDYGHIQGLNGDGILLEDIAGNVSVENRHGNSAANESKIEGSNDGLNASNVGGTVSIDNQDGGTIAGSTGDGIDLSNIGGHVGIDNHDGGEISGGGYGVVISGVSADGVTINNEDGSISGTDESGIALSSIVGDVSIDNDGGWISGGDEGIAMNGITGGVDIHNWGGSITGYWDGIDVSQVSGDVVVHNSFNGSIAGTHGDGVDLDAIGGNVTVYNIFGTISGADEGVTVSNVDGNVTVDNRFGGDITGSDGDGVHIRDVGGSVAVKNSVFGDITGHDDGVHVSNVDDSVTITNRFGGSITGETDDGIYVRDVGGSVDISNIFGGDIFGHDNGVRVRNVDGDVSIDNYFGGSIAGETDDGIYVRNVGGSVDIANSFGGSITGDENGVRVRNVDGDVSISNAFGGDITGQDDDGVHITGVGGSVDITNAFGGHITEADDGIRVAHVDDDVTIDNAFGGRIRGGNDDGIDIHDVGGNVSVYNDAYGRIRGDDNGIHIDDVGGTVLVGNEGGRITGSNGDGVEIVDVSGEIVINNDAGRIRGDENGIFIWGAGSDVTINNGDGSIRGRNDNGIFVSADGTVTINNGEDGLIRGATSAIAIDAQTAEINSDGVIRGSGVSDATINVTTVDGATINNNAGGTIRGDAYAPTDLIVEAHGGAVTINNAGTMMGQVDLSDAGIATGNIFNNTSDHSWTFTGTSQLGNGLDDTFNNTGTVFTTDPNAPWINDVTELAGVEEFNNGNATDDGLVTMLDGYTGDVTTLSPTTGGTLMFNGADGHSFLAVDSFLGSEADSSSDRLVVLGNVTGSTGVIVNNLNLGFGSYNPTGIEVVSVDGYESPSNFFLVGGPIDTGMFTYDLYLNGSNEWVLASAPNHIFFELPSFISAAQSMWHDAAGVWLDRTADLRAARGYECAPTGLKDTSNSCGGRPTSGVWAKVLGQSESRKTDHTFSLFDTVQTHTVDYRQDGAGVMGGYDVVRNAEDGGIWMAGIMGGYLASNVDFKNSMTNADFRGGSVGGYVTYLKGGWFLDAKVMANIGNVDYHSSWSVKDNANVISIGGVLDTGYRMNTGSTFIEPGATLAYVNTNIDDLSIFGTSAFRHDGP